MSLKQRLDRIEKMANPKEIVAASWAVLHFEAEQEFQKIFNKMKIKYGGGEPITLLSADDVQQRAKELTAKYGTYERYQQSRRLTPEAEQRMRELAGKYGLG